jgi:hypothetical protein
MESNTPRTLTFKPSGFKAVVPAGAAARADGYASQMMDDGELRYLASIALAFPWSPEGVVVEIGSYSGMTAAFVAEVLAEAGFDNRVLSIDPFERVPNTRKNPQGKYKRYLRTMQERGLEDRCLPLVAYSQHAAIVVPDRVGLLIVDGNHEYESVARDLALFAPKVLPGGFIFLDDHTETYPGVINAVEEFVDSTAGFELLHRSYFAILRRRS